MIKGLRKRRNKALPPVLLGVSHVPLCPVLVRRMAHQQQASNQISPPLHVL